MIASHESIREDTNSWSNTVHFFPEYSTKMKSICALVLALCIGNAVSLSVMKIRELVGEKNLLPQLEDPVKSQADSGKHWALIVAGSNTWYNYRHQVSELVGFRLLTLSLSQFSLKVDVPILPCVFYTFNWLTLTSEMACFMREGTSTIAVYGKHIFQNNFSLTIMLEMFCCLN